MSKTLKTQNLIERSGSRALLAISLCASMAAFGCTTDRNLGNGDPVTTPGLRTSPIGGTSSGSETPALPPPMMSSYSGTQALPAVRPRVAPQATAAEVAAILAEHQPRVRVLGVVSPGNNTHAYASDRIALAYGPASVANGNSINSTIYNPNPTGAAITSGAGEVITSDAAAADFLATNGTTSAATVTNTGAAATIVPSASGALTPTGAAIPVPSGFAAIGTLSPTAAAVVNPPASVSGSPALATTSSSRTAGRTLTTTTPTATTATTTNATATSVTAATTVNGATASSNVSPVRVMNTNGRIVITNSTSSGRQQ